MPTSTVQVADAVLSALNDASLSTDFTAVRLYVPSYELSELDTLHVSVVPRAKRTKMLDRRRRTREFDIDIGVQQRFSEEALGPIDSLLELAEEIDEYFADGRTLDDLPIACWIRNSHDPIYVPEHWDEMNQFTSVVTVTYRVDE